MSNRSGTLLLTSTAIVLLSLIVSLPVLRSGSHRQDDTRAAAIRSQALDPIGDSHSQPADEASSLDVQTPVLPWVVNESIAFVLSTKSLETWLQVSLPPGWDVQEFQPNAVAFRSNEISRDHPTGAYVRFSLNGALVENPAAEESVGALQTRIGLVQRYQHTDELGLTVRRYDLGSASGLGAEAQAQLRLVASVHSPSDKLTRETLLNDLDQLVAGMRYSSDRSLDNEWQSSLHECLGHSYELFMPSAFELECTSDGLHASGRLPGVTELVVVHLHDSRKVAGPVVSGYPMFDRPSRIVDTQRDGPFAVREYLGWDSVDNLWELGVTVRVPETKMFSDEWLAVEQALRRIFVRSRVVVAEPSLGPTATPRTVIPIPPGEPTEATEYETSDM
ncbi:MAG: hypothetical protein H6648_02960 [Caldilineae bacterium]|nr:hypothetical protein [Caldilineae bacterium]